MCDCYFVTYCAVRTAILNFNPLSTHGKIASISFYIIYIAFMTNTLKRKKKTPTLKIIVGGMQLCNS